MPRKHLTRKVRGPGRERLLRVSGSSSGMSSMVSWSVSMPDNSSLMFLWISSGISSSVMVLSMVGVVVVTISSSIDVLPMSLLSAKLRKTIVKKIVMTNIAEFMVGLELSESEGKVQLLLYPALLIGEQRKGKERVLRRPT